MRFLKKFGIQIADIVVVSFLILISFSVWIPFSKNDSEKTVILMQGTKTENFPLAEDREILLDCGGTIRIENGSVSAENMPCPDKLCEKCGKISQERESILCLPNHIAVKIISNNPENLDGISE